MKLETLLCFGCGFPRCELCALCGKFRICKRLGLEDAKLELGVTVLREDAKLELGATALRARASWDEMRDTGYEMSPLSSVFSFAPFASFA